MDRLAKAVRVPQRDQAEFQRLNILLVDDNRYMRLTIRAILSAGGIKRVVEAVDGADAFKAMHTFYPDLVLTNWNMAPLDGLEFVRLVRQARDSANPFASIIMITAFTEKHRVTAARDVGVNEFLAKPISAAALWSRMHAVLYHPRPFVRTPRYFGPDRRRHSNYNYRGPERRHGAPAQFFYPEGGLMPSERLYREGPPPAPPPPVQPLDPHDMLANPAQVPGRPPFPGMSGIAAAPRAPFKP